MIQTTMLEASSIDQILYVWGEDDGDITVIYGPHRDYSDKHRWYIGLFVSLSYNHDTPLPRNWLMVS